MFCHSDDTLHTIQTAINTVTNSHDPISITTLKGGNSGSLIFCAETSNHHKYVVRFLNNNITLATNNIVDAHAKEVICAKIASDNGYGPKLHLFDAENNLMVMDYLPPEPPAPCSQQSDERCRALVDFLKKMHYGPSFPKTGTVFDQIDMFLENVSKQNKFVTKTELDKCFAISHTIQAALKNYHHTAPCHRDLHTNNVLFSQGKFYAIDYELAGQDDPFFDLALIAHFNKLQDEQLLSFYLRRMPSTQEIAKIYLMKQLLLVYYTAIVIILVPEDFPDSNIPFDTYQHMLPQNPAEIDLGNSIHKLGVASRAYHKALINFETDECQNALKIVSQYKAISI